VSEPVYRTDPYARRCEAEVVASGDGWVRLVRTVFYPTGGGQPGDSGQLVGGDQTFTVVEAVKADGDEDVVHKLADSGSPAVGSQVAAVLDWERRYAHMRMHSALHLLCAAVNQAVTGGQIGATRSRLDFDVGDARLDKEAITARLMAWIADDRPIGARWVEADELARRPELVRTMSVRPPASGGRVRLIEIEGVDLQACGGTHVRSTGEIGSVRVGKIENKGRQNRRVNLLLEA
jgi:misacylated tRNA(Ala) deacylase